MSCDGARPSSSSKASARPPSFISRSLRRVSWSIIGDPHAGAGAAVAWMATQLQGFGFTVEHHAFRAGMAPNVIATKLGIATPDRVVVVGAHYDSRSTDVNSPTMAAPGANDDASGTSCVLAFAKLVFDNQLTFDNTIVLGLWGGEEQGLVGSRAYAQRERQRNVNIIAMFQADMVVYRTTEPQQIGFPLRFHTPALTALAKSTANTYVPAIRTCDTNACCSDQQSFVEQGYQATLFFERCGNILDPQYHRSGDTMNRAGYDLDGEMTSIAKAFTAISLITAGLRA